MGASVLVILFDARRLYFDFGYDSYDQEINVPLLLTSTSLQLVCELGVDVLSLYVERMHGIDVVKAWNHRFQGFFVCVWVGSTFAFSEFLGGFSRVPPECFCPCPTNLTYIVHQEYCDAWWNTTNGTSGAL